MGNAAASERRLWWIFFVLGMGTLLPWNFFITPYSYWQDKLSTENSTNSTQQNIYQEFWAASLGLTTMLTNFLMCLLTSILMGKISKSIRFYVPMIGIGGCFGICAVMAQMDSSEWVTAFFASTLALTIVITVFCAIFQSSLFGLGAEIGGKCVAAIMAGQGAGGVFACVIDLISKLAIPEELSLAACMYFVIAVVFMIISVGMFYILQRMSAYQDVDQMIEIDKFDLQKKSFINDQEENENHESEIKKEEKSRETDETAFGAIKRVVWPFHLVLVLTFTMTLSVFPGVVAGYQSVNHDPTNRYYGKGFYTTIWVFLNFNLFDFIGRSLGGPMTNPDSKLNFIKQNQVIIIIFYY
jgi:equilibrative nucleoside transporter 1/2/3